MSQEFRREYLLRLPLPLAHLYGAAYNAKDPRQRHDNAFYLCEALVKLAAAPLVAAYLNEAERGGPRVGALDRLLAQLALPSLGQWVAMLRELARHFGRRPDAATHPFGGAATRLDAPRDLPGLTALYRRIKNGPDGQPAGDQSCSPLQIFDALVQYRNGVFGHGGPRFAAFFEREMGPLLFPAVNDLLAEGVVDPLGPGGRLVTITELNILGDGRVEVGLRELSGLRGERAEPLVLAASAATGLAPDRVALLRPGGAAPLRLDPLLVYREGELVEEVLFLNRDRNGRQVEYLSYTTGRAERDKTMAPALAALLSRVTGRPVGEDELQALAEQSRAEAPSVEALFAVPPAPETRLGDFELLGELGRGGMGVVYLARQLSLGRLVALKMLPGDLSADPTALARFQREIRALARCDHPHIVKVLASGALPDGRLYYAMEYVPGCDLEHVWRELSGPEGREAAARLGGTSWARAVLSASRKRREQTTGRGADPTVADKGDTKKPLPLTPLPELPSAPDDPGGYVRRVAALVRDAAFALQTVHDHHLVHRDVKPANLMLTPDGSRVVLMDFGLAKGESAALTDSRAGGLLGTLRYAAPEQLAAANVAVGPAADVRGLGVTLWELLTRRRLFGDAADEAQLAQRVLTEDVPRLRRVDRTLDRDLDAIVARATERSAADRIPTAGRLAEYLQLYLDGKPLPIRPPGPAERAARWVRRRPAASALMALVVLLLVGASAAGWWYYDRFVRVHIDYFAASTKRWGAFEGVGRLTDEQVQNRSYSLKFFTRAGRVERVEVVDGRGGLTSDFPPLHYMDSLEPGAPGQTPNQAGTPRRECCYRFEYDAGGRITDEIDCDRSGAVVLRFHYSSPTTGEFTDGHGYPSARTSSGAAYVEFTRDKDGRDVECRYYDNSRRPQPDAQGAYGWRREWDDNGFARRLTLLDAEGNPFQGNNGYAAVEGENDPWGNVTAVRYYKADGVRTWHRDGYAEVRNVWDSYGRLREKTFLDMAARPVRARSGFVRLRWTYTAPDDWVCEYLDGDGRPDPIWGDAAKMKLEVVCRDAAGRTLRVTFLDASDRPTRAAAWAASKVVVEDADGRPLEKSYFGPDGRPTYTRDGPAREVQKHDESGNVVLWEAYDTDGALMRGPDGYARRQCVYDDRQRLIKESYEGPDGKPTVNKDGYAMKRITYDGDGKEVGEAFFDAAGNPTRRRDGYSSSREDYDSLGRLKQTSYFGPDGKPTWTKEGAGGVLSVKDARGNPTSVTTLAPDGRPVIAWNGACEIRRAFDDWGAWTREAYYGPAGQPCRAIDGSSAVERTLDRLGNPLTLSYFGLGGEKVLCKSGYWQECDEYDDRGRLVRRTYHDVDGTLRATAENTAEVRQKYDGCAEPTEFLYRGAAGGPALQEGRYGRRVRSYDDRGLLTSESFFGLGLTDPADGGRGYARAEQKFDARGRVASLRFFGADGKPCRNGDGAFGVDRAYDDRGLCVEESFVDADGKPLPLGRGYCKVRTVFDARGNPTEQRYFGVHDELVVGPTGYALARTDYDERDNKTSVRYFGPDEKPCAGREGYAEAGRRYSDFDSVVEEEFHGADGALVNAPSHGYARMVKSYTAHGFEASVEYFGADGKPANGKEGYSRVVVARDDADKETGSTLYDRDGRELRWAVVVAGVEAGKAADQKGIKKGDILTRYDGLVIEDMNRFVRGRAGEPPGGPDHTLAVRRGDKELEFRVSPGPLGIQMHYTLLPAPPPSGDQPDDRGK